MAKDLKFNSRGHLVDSNLTSGSINGGRSGILVSLDNPCTRDKHKYPWVYCE